MSGELTVPGGAEEFPIPEGHVHFLGGPLDGTCLEIEYDVDDVLNGIEYPEWIVPAGYEDVAAYWLYVEHEPPHWVFNPPEMDFFAQTYVWGPYYQTETAIPAIADE